MKKLDNYISNEKFSSLDEYITEKLKIGKNTLSNNSDIDIDLSNEEIFKDVIDDVIKYCNKLTIKPEKITDEYITKHNAIIKYDHMLLILIPDIILCFGIIIRNKNTADNLVSVIGIATGKILYSHSKRTLDQIFKIIDDTTIEFYEKYK